MNPILCEFDLLEIVPYGDRAERIGDVILCLPPEGDQLVVHRIASVLPRGIRTRGDNNLNDDPYLLQSANIIGQVVAAWRRQKRRKIVGGWAGWLLAHLIRCWHLLDRRVFLLLRPIYHTLARSGIICRLLPNRFSPRVVLFQANGCRYLRLFLGRRIIGQYEYQQHQWRIQRPFRLFVDNRRLPDAQTLRSFLLK